MKKFDNFGKFSDKKFRTGIFQFVFPISKKVFRATLHGSLGHYGPMQDPQFVD